MNPLVTVSVPVFNGLPYLIETLESVSKQTYPNLEIVLVDGGSDDTTIDYLHSIRESVTCIEFLPKGTPVADTWTRSVELSHGEFIKLLCQDDLLYPWAIQSQLDFLLGEPLAGLVFSKRDIVNADGLIVAKARGGVPGGTRVLEGREALRFGYLAGANVYGEPEAVLFRRGALMEQLPWDASIPYLIDMEMYARVMMAGSVGFLNETVGAFRISAQSWSTRLTAEQTEQFRQWQGRVSAFLDDVTPLERQRAKWNAMRISWTRSAAYAWLRFRGGLS